MEKMTSKKGKVDIMVLPRRTPDLYAMNAGDGPRSYVQNSSYQRGVVDIAKPIIEDEIARKLDIKHPSPTSPNGFWVADFGCSTGHNSFPAMQIITQAIYRKHASSGLITSQIPEFFVFFNDVITNDFNTLFTSLPPRRHCTAIRVPGDFHSRLLPESSLHFAYSSWALQWLTQVPKEVVERDSPAWNNRAILYTRDRKEVCDAYLNQYVKDIEAFLEARAVEMVSGGLMALLVPAVPAFWNLETEYTIPSDLNLLGSCLLDMAEKGRLSEEKIDSFNFPTYYTFPEELKAIIERNNSYNIERMEVLDNPGTYAVTSAHAHAPVYRAVFEDLMTNHFGCEIIGELFDTYRQKLEASPDLLLPEKDKSIIIFVLLKRKLE